MALTVSPPNEHWLCSRRSCYRKGHHDPDSVNVCQKVEIYKELEGGYNCTHPHSVSMDVLMYEFADDKKQSIKTEYHGFNLEKNRYKTEWLFPLGNLIYEMKCCLLYHSSSTFLTSTLFNVLICLFASFLIHLLPCFPFLTFLQCWAVLCSAVLFQCFLSV